MESMIAVFLLFVFLVLLFCCGVVIILQLCLFPSLTSTIRGVGSLARNILALHSQQRGREPRVEPNPHAYPTEECPICTENIINKCCLNCNHQFCIKCVSSLCQRSNSRHISCPLCRANVSVIVPYVHSRSDPDLQSHLRVVEQYNKKFSEEQSVRREDNRSC